MYRFVKRALFAALLAGATGPVYSADIIEEPVVVPVVVGGWYIRGHIGMSNQYFDGLESELFSVPYAHGWYDEGGFSSAPIFGGGVGYKFNDYFRSDVTVEWRGKSDFYALDWLQEDELDPAIATNEYTGTKSELAFLVNGYYDFGNFYGITPYVGAGIGASYNTISHFRDANIQANGGGWAGDNSEWNLAWALHAGLGFQATDRMTIDLGYSFTSLGDAKTGVLYNDDPLYNMDNDGIDFKSIYSHDFKLGVRYSLY
jgi:opacity protein-like surface antigen